MFESSKRLPLVVGLLAFIPLILADTSLGCFSSVDYASLSTTQYQTPSACGDTCSDYAYVALKNGASCYCLNEYPTSNSVSSDKCSIECPGYGLLTCGGTNYYQVYKGTGSGTIGAGSYSSASASGSSGSSSAGTSGSSATSSSSSATSSSSLNSGSSSTSSTQSSTLVTSIVSASSSDISSSSESSSSSSTTPATSKSSSSETSSASSSASGGSSKKSTNVGAIAGGVVGGVAGIAIIAAIVFLIIRYKNSEEEDDDEGFNYDTKKSSGLSRGPSKNAPNPLDMPMSNPFTHPSDSIVAGGARNQNGGLVDPRLNPVMMGRRRLSEGSLADEADYSRKILQVANPDH